MFLPKLSGFLCTALVILWFFIQYFGTSGVCPRPTKNNIQIIQIWCVCERTGTFLFSRTGLCALHMHPRLFLPNFPGSNITQYKIIIWSYFKLELIFRVFSIILIHFIANYSKNIQIRHLSTDFAPSKLAPKWSNLAIWPLFDPWILT